MNDLNGTPPNFVLKKLKKGRPKIRIKVGQAKKIRKRVTLEPYVARGLRFCPESKNSILFGLEEIISLINIREGRSLQLTGDSKLLIEAIRQIGIILKTLIEEKK